MLIQGKWAFLLKRPNIDLLLWSLYVCLTILRNAYQNPETAVWEVLTIAVFIVPVYYMIDAVMAFFIRKARWVSGLLALALGLVPFYLYGAFIIYVVLEAWIGIQVSRPEVAFDMREYLGNMGFMYGRTLIYAAFIRAVRLLLETIQKKLEAEQEKNRVQDVFLRFEIGQHFLSSSFNFLLLRAVQRKDEESVQVIEGLSYLTDYCLDSAADRLSLVALSREVQAVDKMVKAIQIRHRKRQVICFDVEGVYTNQVVPPMTFLTVVENITKYGWLEEEHPATISLQLEPDGYTFRARNRISATPAIYTARERQGIGLDNIRQRLEILLPGQHRLDIREVNSYFTVELEVKV